MVMKSVRLLVLKSLSYLHLCVRARVQAEVLHRQQPFEVALSRMFPEHRKNLDEDDKSICCKSEKR